MKEDIPVWTCPRCKKKDIHYYDASGIFKCNSCKWESEQEDE